MSLRSPVPLNNKSLSFKSTPTCSRTIFYEKLPRLGRVLPPLDRYSILLFRVISQQHNHRKILLRPWFRVPVMPSKDIQPEIGDLSFIRCNLVGVKKRTNEEKNHDELNTFSAVETKVESSFKNSIPSTLVECLIKIYVGTGKSKSRLKPAM